MAVILQMMYSKKLGLPNFSSHSCSVSLQVEIPHSELIESVERTVRNSGLIIGNQAHSQTHDGARYFGLMEVRAYISAPDYCWVMGLRNSHDKTFPAGITAGAQLFVCDNLSFSGEVKLARKHTRFICRNLPFLVQTAVGKLLDRWHRQDSRIETYKLSDIEGRTAHDLLIRACDVGVYPNRQLPQVLHEWQRPRHEEFEPIVFSIEGARGLVSKRFVHSLGDANPKV
jgi:hypothetical protein